MDVCTHLREQGIAFEVLDHPTTYTAQELAAQQHIPGQNVVKPVVVWTDRGYVMCVLPASCRLDLEPVASAIGASEARLATEKEMGDLFGDCELGAEPPLGALFGLPTLMDESLRQDEFVVFQAGTHDRAVKLAERDYEKLASPQVARIAHHL